MDNKKLRQRGIYDLIVDITKFENKESCFQNVKNIVQTNTRNIPLPDVDIVNVESQLKYKGNVKTKYPQIIDYCKKDIIENNISLGKLKK